MVATPVPSHPQFTFHFLAVRRADLRDRPHRESVTAPDESAARRLLAREFVLLFAGRVPVQGCAMFDNTPLEPEEIIDQCRALTCAAARLDHPQVREILVFLLQERIDCLYRTFQAENAATGTECEGVAHD